MNHAPFDIRSVSLRGTQLVEASAGTGKTYNIVSAYLRLLAEPGLSATVESILVVTFTEAATAELRQKIRERLSTVIAQVGSGEATDALAAWALGGGPSEVARILKRWEQALHAFDTAEIHTIHGLCRRILEQHGLLVGVAGGAQILADTKQLYEEIVRQYLAREVYDAPSWFSRVVRDLVVPDELVRFVEETSVLSELERVSGNPRVFPEALGRDDEKFDAIRSSFTRARSVWNQSRSEIIELLGTTVGFNQRYYGKGKLDSLIASVAQYFEGDDPLSNADLGKFAQITEGSFRMNKGYQEPRHAFFGELARLLVELDGFAESQRRQFLRRLLSFAAVELDRRKRADGVMTFDDLVLRLSEALRSECGASLVSALRERFCVALVDEFQDTDAEQYAIFERVFKEGGLPLFLIGDPKQSIYGFRGADVYAYLEARQHAEQQFTLGTNRRSTPSLVRAVNAIFSRQDSPFGRSGIVFEPAIPFVSGCPDGEEDAPLEIVFLSRRSFAGASGKISEREALAVAIEMTAEQIADRGPPGERRTVAVLVRRNRDVEPVKRALRARGIAAVGLMDESVLGTQEAQELCTVFTALLEPSDQRKVRAALLTPLLGYSADEVIETERSEEAGLHFAEQIRRAAQQWETAGAICALRSLLAETHDGKSRAQSLVEREDGLGKLVNYEHVVELMSAAACQAGAPLSAQLRWLEARLDGTDKEEGRALRLSADASAVRVMTVHKSKGLEFDEVYCPAIWMATDRRARDWATVYHDASGDGRRCVYILPPDDHPAVDQAHLEQFEEEIRLAYVALTRAKRRCVLFDGAFDARARATAWLLHAQRGSTDPFAAMREVASFDDDALVQDLERLAADSACPSTGRSVIAVRVPQGPAVRTRSGAMNAEGSLSDKETTLQVRAHIPVSVRRNAVFSFTSLCVASDERPQSTGRDTPSEPSLRTPETASTRGASLESFEKGPHAGDMLHKVLEGLPFGSLDLRDLECRTAQALSSFGFDVDKWSGPLARDLWKMLHSPLVETDPGMTLASISQGKALAELEFLLPLNDERFGGGQSLPQRLARAFSEHGGDQADYAQWVEQISPQSLRGYLRGFIDLVFERDGVYFIIDYKSTDLGEAADAYDSASLTRAMRQNHYVLQYHIYALALTRFLGSFGPDYSQERDFGGVFYLFLRGIAKSSAPSAGVFFDRPSTAMLDALADALCVVGKGKVR